jgi:DNA invertase Pin-like site-specific DNA recombinase/DNA-binding XRE family transcriptional regulator
VDGLGGEVSNGLPQRPAVYCRISKDIEGTGLGVERQRKECVALARRLGWGEPTFYIDNDVSAFRRRTPRPSYQRLLSDITSATVDGVLCWHPDRLHRHPVELETFIDLLDTSGIPVMTVTAGEWDLTTATGRGVARLLGVVAHMECDHKSERIKAKMAEIVADGRPNGGVTGFGHRRANKQIFIDPTEARLIRRAATDVLRGTSMADVARRWQVAGVPTVCGARWSASSVARILHSARIAGLRTHRGKVVGPAEWPAIIDAPTWQRLETLFASRIHKPCVEVPSALNGILICYRCQGAMPARRSLSAGIHYQCDCCHGTKVVARYADAVVTSEVLCRVGEHTRAAVLWGDAGRDDARLTELIADDESELRALATAAKAGRVRVAVLVEVGAAIEARISANRAALSAPDRAERGSPLDDDQPLWATWPDMTPKERGRVIRAVVGPVEVGRGAAVGGGSASYRAVARRLSFAPSDRQGAAAEIARESSATGTDRGLDPRDEVAGVDAESLGQAEQGLHRDVALATLDVRDVAVVQAAPLREVFLAEASGMAELANASSEGPQNGGILHADRRYGDPTDSSSPEWVNSPPNVRRAPRSREGRSRPATTPAGSTTATNRVLTYRRSKRSNRGAMARAKKRVDPMAEFGQRVRDRRHELGLSQDAFAAVVGLHRTYIGSLELGKRNVSLNNIVRLAAALRVDPGELLRGLSP